MSSCSDHPTWRSLLRSYNKLVGQFISNNPKKTIAKFYEIISKWLKYINYNVIYILALGTLYFCVCMSRGHVGPNMSNVLSRLSRFNSIIRELLISASELYNSKPCKRKLCLYRVPWQHGLPLIPTHALKKEIVRALLWYFV